MAFNTMTMEASSDKGLQATLIRRKNTEIIYWPNIIFKTNPLLGKESAGKAGLIGDLFRRGHRATFLPVEMHQWKGCVLWIYMSYSRKFAGHF